MLDLRVVALWLLGVLYCTSTSPVLASDLPGGITKCDISDDKCLRDNINYVLKNNAKSGIKPLGLVPIDPLQIKKLSLGRNPNSPVNIDLTFTNAQLLGLGEAQAKKVSPFSLDLLRDITLDMFAPKIILKGPYTVDGRVLILPIKGSGDAEIVLENCKVVAVVKLKAVSKGPRQTYAEVQAVNLQLEPKHVTYRLDGLFNGDKAAGENFHALINDNWKEIFNELKADISSATGLIFKAVLERTLSKLPIEQLFSGV